MGLEAESELVINGQTIHVKALLESQILIFRGAVKKTLPIADLHNVHVVNDQLLFEHLTTPYILSLPVGQAAKWLKKLTTAPPSLTQKLGLDSGHRTLVWGQVDDAALNAALIDVVTTNPLQAVMAIAVARSPDDLSAALSELTSRLPHAPLWIVYPKGAKSPLPDSAVRSHMRALGFIDTKVSAVSDALTATRFLRPKS